MNYLTDGSNDDPRLAHFLNDGTIEQLPPNTSFPSLEGCELVAYIREQGFEGIQTSDSCLLQNAQDAGLKTAIAGGRDDASDYGDFARRVVDGGHVAATLHVGNGLEDDDAGDRLIGSILEASAKFDVPLYVETHRATLTQDVWRTVQLAKRHPTLLFNADLSHWYTGLEMPYAGVELVRDFAAPVLERVGFVHGRIGNGGSMQTTIGDGTAESMSGNMSAGAVDHFSLLWSRIFSNFKRQAPAGTYLPFAPELLHAGIFYARAFNGVEETDRWEQALVMTRMAQKLFDAAE